jgi:hypothetical protein
VIGSSGDLRNATVRMSVPVRTPKQQDHPIIR